jgi:hypothetical protein
MASTASPPTRPCGCDELGKSPDLRGPLWRSGDGVVLPPLSCNVCSPLGNQVDLYTVQRYLTTYSCLPNSRKLGITAVFIVWSRNCSGPLARCRANLLLCGIRTMMSDVPEVFFLSVRLLSIHNYLLSLCDKVLSKLQGRCKLYGSM